MATKKVARSFKSTKRGKAGAKAPPETEQGSAKPTGTLLVRRVEMECLAETLDEQMDQLLGISGGLLAEADEAETALSILLQLKLKRDMVRDALKGQGSMASMEVQS